MINYLLLIIFTSIISILTYKFYFNYPNEIIKFKYINDCYNNDQIPTNILFKNIFDQPNIWIGS